MAKLEKTLAVDFDALLGRIEQGILEGSISASLEGSSDFSAGDARGSVRVYERCSYAGGSRRSQGEALVQSGAGGIRTRGPQGLHHFQFGVGQSFHVRCTLLSFIYVNCS